MDLPPLALVQEAADSLGMTRAGVLPATCVDGTWVLR